MEKITLTISGVKLDIDGCIIEPDEKYGQIGYDFDVFDITHKGESVYDLIDEYTLGLIVEKSIESYKEMQQSKELGED